MASKNKHRRFFRSEDTERRVDPEHEDINKIQLTKIIDFLHDFYGIEKKFFDDYIFMKLGKDVWMTTKSAKNMLSVCKSGLTVNSIGVRVLRNAFEVPKPTTNFVIFLNEKITKNFYEMNEKELDEYTHGYEIKMRYDNEFKNYLIMKHKNQTYGVGLISEGTIKSQVPKGRKLKNQLASIKEEVIDE